MAKQTFSTGQVLTAAQMTSLQQTAMGGGSPVTKTASYVLTAADAGTTIQMNSASSTTITVNTALFAAGDVVFIQNIGAGVCTITAGTATVTTAGSLALTQWEGGQLFFTSTGAAIFFDYIQAGVSIPLTTKGDLFGYSTTNARIPVGANNTVLTADSAEALGVKWAAVAGGSMTLLSTTTLSGASTVISSISQSYTDLKICINNAGVTSTGWQLQVRPNSSAVVEQSGMYGTTTYTQLGGSILPFNGGGNTSGNDASTFVIYISNYTDAFGDRMPFYFYGGYANTSISLCGSNGGGYWRGNAAITSLEVATSASTFNGGTVRIYGVN